MSDTVNNGGRLRTALLVMCILSIVAIAFTSMMDLVFMYSATIPRETVKEMLEMQGQMYESAQIDMVMNVFSYGQYHLLFNVLELAGVIFLLARRFVGFHIYAASQIGFCYVSYMAMGLSGSGSMIFFNLLWTLLYFMQSRYLSQSK